MTDRLVSEQRIAELARSPAESMRAGPSFEEADEVIQEVIRQAAREAGEAAARACESLGWGKNEFISPKAGTECAAEIRKRLPKPPEWEKKDG